MLVQGGKMHTFLPWVPHVFDGGGLTTNPGFGLTNHISEKNRPNPYRRARVSCGTGKS